MKQFTCPMHPEIIREKPGRCPKCGMKLIQKTHKGMTHAAEIAHTIHEEKTSWKSYLPLIVIIALIILTSSVISWRDFQLGNFAQEKFIMYFMSGFFLVFAGFKLMDLKGFAEGYATYDILAKKWFAYGYIYPFIELFFGLAMILNIQPQRVLWAELLVMGFSGLGVALKLAKREKFQCACLGTFLKVPLTKVTLVEDFGMAFLAALLLFLQM
jgi:hypothetical protein